MAQERTHVILPEDLLTEIDALVGQGGRTAFLVEVVRDEIRRRRLLQILDDPEPIWKNEDHPELTNGAEAWVRCLREEDDRSQHEKLSEWLSQSQ